MKLIAYILVIGIGILGMNRFMIGTQFVMQETEQTCHIECCGGGDGSVGVEKYAHETESGDEEDGIDLTHTCPNVCDCSCCYHIMAITYLFISAPFTMVQSYHYGEYINDYHFEYKTPLFEPPRFG